MGNFVVITTGCSGSTWLKECMGSHPEIRAYGEVCQMDDPPFLQKIIRSKEKKCVGFKFLYSHLGYSPTTWQKLIENEFKVIHLIRNPLDIAISLMLRTKNKNKNVYYSHKLYEHIKIGDELINSIKSANRIIGTLVARRLNIPYKASEDTCFTKGLVQLTQYILQIKIWVIGEIKNSKLPFLNINYKNMDRDINYEFKKICSFLDVDYSDPKFKIKKRRMNLRQKDIVEDYDQLITHLSEKNLIHLLDEPLYF